MAVAAYTSDLVNVIVDMASTTGWSALGGGASGLAAPETDYFEQGSNCISKAAWAGAAKGMIYSVGSQIPWTINVNAVFAWITHLTPNSLATQALGGIQILIGQSTSVYRSYYVSGSDKIKDGAPWLCAVIGDSNLADFVSGTVTSETYVGGIANLPTTGPTKGAPFAIDAIRVGRAFTITNGDLANGYATFVGAAAWNDDITRKYGQFQGISGGYQMQGLMSFGSSGTTVDFRDSNRSILLLDANKTWATFSGFEVRNASSRVDWSNVNVTALGTLAKGYFTVVEDATVNLDTCVFTDFGPCNFKSNSVISLTTFRRSEVISTTGATFTSCTFDKSFSGTSASTATTALTEFNDCRFISNGNSHAVKLNSIGAGSMNWGNTLSGYVAGTSASPVTPTSTGNEAIYVNVSAGTLTINVLTGADIPSIRSAGATVNVVAGQVTTNITVTDVITGLPIENSRVFLEVFSGGSENYRESVTITRATTTATVTHASHGLSTGNKVRILGATQNDYNGVKTITVTGLSAYTFTVANSPTTPATGTITSTTVIIDGVANASGLVTDTRTFAVNQPVRGRARKSSTGNLYKTSPIVATIDKDSGLDLGVQMIPD